MRNAQPSHLGVCRVSWLMNSYIASLELLSESLNSAPSPLPRSEKLRLNLRAALLCRQKERGFETGQAVPVASALLQATRTQAGELQDWATERTCVGKHQDFLIYSPWRWGYPQRFLSKLLVDVRALGFVLPL